MIKNLLKKHKTEPIFSSDWFSETSDVWAKQLSTFKDQPNLRYLEVGVYEGRSLIWMLQNILTHPTSHGTGVEIFVGCSKSRLIDNISAYGINKGKFKIIEGNSRKIFRELPLDSYDIIFIDGDHRGQGALMDAILAWDLLKEGGIMIYDDYSLHSSTNPPEANVKTSGDCFLTLFQNELELVHHDYDRHFFVRKIPLRSGEYSTQAGPFCFIWGEKVEDRHIMDARTNAPVDLPQAALNELAERLLARKLGILRIDTDEVSKEHLDILLEKVPDFFKL